MVFHIMLWIIFSVRLVSPMYHNILIGDIWYTQSIVPGIINANKMAMDSYGDIFFINASILYRWDKSSGSQLVKEFSHLDSYDVCFDHKGNLLVATRKGLKTLLSIRSALELFDKPHVGTIDYYKAISAEHHIKSIYTGLNNKMYFISMDKNIIESYIIYSNLSIEDYHFAGKKLSQRSENIAVNFNGEIYYTSSDELFYKTAKNTQKVTGIHPSATIFTLTLDFNEDLLVGTDDGMYFLRKNKLNAEKIDGISYAKCICFARNGTMIVQMLKDVYKMEPMIGDIGYDLETIIIIVWPMSVLISASLSSLCAVCIIRKYRFYSYPVESNDVNGGISMAQIATPEQIKDPEVFKKAKKDIFFKNSPKPVDLNKDNNISNNRIMMSSIERTLKKDEIADRRMSFYRSSASSVSDSFDNESIYASEENVYEPI